jgi:hypothetical protein
MTIPLRTIALALFLVAPGLPAQAATKPAPAKSVTAKPAAAKTPATPATAKPVPTKARPDAAKAASNKPVTPKAKPAPKPKPKNLRLVDPLSHAEQDGFGVLQTAAPDATRFIADWKLGVGAKTASTSTIANKPLFTFLIFRGCKANAEGKCDVVADFVITRPDGTTDESNKGVAVWNKAAPADPKKPYIGDGALGFGTDEEGPFGDYRIVATVTDRVAGVSVTTEQTLTIAPGPAAATPAPPAK